MKKELSRRDLIGRAGLALGGLVTLGVACGDDPAAPCQPAVCPDPVDPGPQVAQFPFQQHLAADYRLDVAAVEEAAYHGYYAGGCCHGAFNGLVKHLADTAGQPFNLLPLDMGMFGGGGVAGYGSICGAVLGGVLTLNFVVPNAGNATPAKANVRNRMMAELMRWYEGFAFPAYAPTAVDAAETGLTRGFNGGGLPAVVPVVPRSHLCHASVTTWCEENGNVPSSGPDKKARCARLTADVAGKVAEMLNGYLATGDFVATSANPTTGCVGCHTQSAAAPAAPVASGMDCTSCHPSSQHTLPASPTHDPLSNCDGCH